MPKLEGLFDGISIRVPVVTGSKHASCEDMLLQIKGARKTSSGSGVPGVMFISAL